MSFATLADLPTELLLTIFQDLEEELLFGIGTLCRRLNDVAISLFLKQEGLPDPEKTSVIRPQHGGYGDVLSALTIHHSVQSIDQFFCILENQQADASSNGVSIRSLIRNVDRVNQLVQKLSSIGSVYITFFSAGTRWSLNSGVVYEFMAALLDLLETCLLKSCTSLHILHQHPMAIETGYTFEVTNTPVSATPKPQESRHPVLSTTPLYTDLHGPGWRYRRGLDGIEPLPISPPPATLQSKLTKLDLYSDFLFVPPLSTWTFAIMKSSPITSFTMSLPHLISKDEFHHFIFPQMVDLLPGLLELRLSFPTDDFLATVVQNLHRFQRLRKLTYGLTFFTRNLIPVVKVSARRPCSLFNLESFTGSPEQAVHLFENTFRCPNLRSVNVLIDVSFRGRYDYDAIAASFSRMNQRFTDMAIKPMISVCFTNHGGRPSHPKDEGEPHWVRHFSVVSRLTLELPLFFRDKRELPQQIEHVVAWLNVFRGLEALTLTTRRPALDASTRDTRDNALSAAVAAIYPNIAHFSVIDLTADNYHYHWSNSRDCLERGIDGMPGATNCRNRSSIPGVCDHF
ncbi:hypothetical protein B0H34DRAFT_714930 [Crassisporium funariophilum]|nr:hypothetical protein B0H34DRAFT_714930 [Crassisporium funariophilum]